MKKLIEGLQEFRKTYVPAHRELLAQLSQAQKPRVMFITCSDSRIDPNLVTQTEIGELFIVRNAGNIIPPYGATNGGEGATIEYAIHALGIEQIIVCGHTHCGAMKGLLHLNKLQEDMPLVYDWLKHAEGTRRLVKDSYTNHSDEEMLEVAVAENVLTQIENLKTYPLVHSRLYQGKLHIYGWVYQIETGEVLAYDPITHTYVHPQSQIVDDDADEPTGKPFVKTSAPPVACEYAPAKVLHSDMAEQSDNEASQEPVPTPWLTPESVRSDLSRIQQEQLSV
ncbi:MAG: carbonic anhydrase [Leptolyngbyaceae cyanobacterium CSU_1_3]|nr:carbonic anhydrase [Leptolyngbyaceae cyanobacterium CSU_1_3]